MPCRMKITVMEARRLPVMDARSRLADAYVAVHVPGNQVWKTAVQPRTLEPVWNQWRQYIMVDRQLQVPKPNTRHSPTHSMHACMHAY